MKMTCSMLLNDKRERFTFAPFTILGLFGARWLRRNFEVSFSLVLLKHPKSSESAHPCGVLASIAT
jgi:hypothetical protein